MDPEEFLSRLFTLLRLKWCVTARQAAASLFCVLPKTSLRSPNVWADRIMFVVPVEK